MNVIIIIIIIISSSSSSSSSNNSSSNNSSSSSGPRTHTIATKRWVGTSVYNAGKEGRKNKLRSESKDSMLIKVASSLTYNLDILFVRVFKGVHALSRYYLIWEC